MPDPTLILNGDDGYFLLNARKLINIGTWPDESNSTIISDYSSGCSFLASLACLSFSPMPVSLAIFLRLAR